MRGQKKTKRAYHARLRYYSEDGKRYSTIQQARKDGVTKLFETSALFRVRNGKLPDNVEGRWITIDKDTESDESMNVLTEQDQADQNESYVPKRKSSRSRKRGTHVENTEELPCNENDDLPVDEEADYTDIEDELARTHDGKADVDEDEEDNA